MAAVLQSHFSEAGHIGLSALDRGFSLWLATAKPAHGPIIAVDRSSAFNTYYPSLIQYRIAVSKLSLASG
ncbi:hypothetical protein X759_34705 [Mesorhizobium sp. LSHC420B00]|nr:hypothetical protein X759_34705 [Mesorhizobium sp. LSHC420B00]